tara:strand:- start:1673 stop:2056 length:384 start_codon:yes stop_codon:yes gene_type:complete
MVVLSNRQTNAKKTDSTDALSRKLIRSAWNNENAVGLINGRNRVVTPFRAVNNSGDFLARDNYICNGPNQLKSAKPGLSNRMGSILSSCDGTGIAAASTNVKFVADSSDYVRYKKQRAVVRNYDDIK